MAFRVAAEERRLCCIDCLVELGKVQAAAVDQACERARERFLSSAR
jgi:hypothetical protein